MADLVTAGGPGNTPAGPNKVVGFYHGVVAELKRVTWPDFPQVRSATIAIIVFVLVIALLITALDAVLQGILIRLIPSLFAR